jgi:hypothetical protein
MAVNDKIWAAEKERGVNSVSEIAGFGVGSGGSKQLIGDRTLHVQVPLLHCNCTLLFM